MDAAKSHIDFPRRRTRRRVSLGLAAVVVATYLYAIAIPRREQGHSMQARIDALDLQRDTLANRVRQLDAPISEPGEVTLPRAVDAAELLPAISALGAQAGVRLSTAKQISTNRKSGESRVRVRATADFRGVVVLLEELAKASDDIVLDDLTILRRTSGGQTARLDVDMVVALQPQVSATDGVGE